MIGRYISAVLAAVVQAKIDIIGYYGNAGNIPSSIPKLSGIDDRYNVLILTFASIDTSGKVTLDLMGPYE